MKRVVRRGKKMQILELTRCSHVGLFVDSHPEFTCPKQSISVSHTWGTRKGNWVMYAREYKQKGHFFLDFLTSWSVESTNTAHTKIRSESKELVSKKRKWAFRRARYDKLNFWVYNHLKVERKREKSVSRLTYCFDGSIHVFRPTCQDTQVSHVSHTWGTTN